MASTQTLVLIGSGPMIGVSAASLFATRKFSNIALISRDATRLSNDRDSVLAAAKAAGKDVTIRTFATDIKNTPAFEKVLEEVETMGHISAVVFNAARVGPSELFKFPEEEIIEDFKVCLHPFLSRDQATNIFNSDDNHSHIHCSPLGHASPGPGDRQPQLSCDLRAPAQRPNPDPVQSGRRQGRTEDIGAHFAKNVPGDPRCAASYQRRCRF